MSSNRALTYLKSEIRSRVLENGTVSAADVVNVMRLHLEGSERGGFVTKAFRDLVSEGVLRPTRRTELNRNTRHQVTVYRAR
jgi:hypothetical protein